MYAAGELTLYDSSQGGIRCKQLIAGALGLPTERVRVISAHVGGGFGSKGLPRPNVMLAAMAAVQLERPVRVVLTRQHQFSLVGYRTPTIQRIKLGADPDGRLRSIDHEAVVQTSRHAEFVEQVVTAYPDDVRRRRTAGPGTGCSPWTCRSRRGSARRGSAPACSRSSRRWTSWPP